jgi:5-(carboxyamino)imidazole ribonucleotide mutase
MASRDSHSRKGSKKAAAATPAAPLVSIIMGSKSDWETMRVASEMLTEFNVPHECRVISAHRTPELLTEFAVAAEGRGIEVIIAGAGGAAHLAGVTAAQTTLPVLGVPIESKSLHGMDSLLSIVQMPGGIPVGTLAIGAPGAKNAALFAIAIMAGKRARLRVGLKAFRERMKRKAAEETLP